VASAQTTGIGVQNVQDRDHDPSRRDIDAGKLMLPGKTRMISDALDVFLAGIDAVFGAEAKDGTGGCKGGRKK
jgi:hypothetical protein